MIQESGTGIGNKIYPGKYKEVAAMRILIAEDEEELAKGLKFLLEKISFPSMWFMTGRKPWTACAVLSMMWLCWIL